MARSHRIVEPDGYYHVTSRGNNSGQIYWDRLDRIAFLGMLARTVRRYRWHVNSYCLMTNHFHLVVQVPDGGLSEGMCELNGGYSRRTNIRYERTGHLFGSRFFSTLIETETHLLEACRYTVLNPVRARLCDTPERWPWSSYRASAGLDFALPFLSGDQFLRLFGPDPARARARYRDFVAAAPPAALGR